MARHPELLIPGKQSGSIETAVMFGADAVVYWRRGIWTSGKSKELSMEDMREGIAFAHEHDVKCT